MISARAVSKSFDGGRTQSVLDLDLDVRPGEFLVLLGESGSGKTTTLKMLNGLIPPSSGAIVVDGEDISRVDQVRLRRRIGYVFQGIGLFPHLSVAENVALVPTLLGWPAEEREQRVDELLRLVHLDPEVYRDRAPSELSGGQRQRVGIARALAGRPRIVLMDEPFGALDPITRDHLQIEYQKIHRDLGLTTVMVTHDITESLLLADRIAVMNGGRLVRLGEPAELIAEPGDPYVAQLLETPRRQAERLGDLLDAGKGAR
ncbi:ATP-binding cassette domain-containing protein [Tautonia sociabilis]|uniref:ATP-binding cassette domain-containing protein n=2 Tax=Tautonia sociabilis TaxID=2080755 RepID=A0A432MJM2_9BACT|nr:ATP-binding cassette domain-containing protein [Tautonia sociabilis]